MTPIFDNLKVFPHPLAALFIVLILAAYITALYRSQFNGKLLRRSALAIFAGGVGIHIYGLAISGVQQGWVVLVMRSVLCSVKMFIYDDSLLELEHAQHIPYFLEAYTLLFFTAIITSLSAIINLFGNQIRTYLVLSLRKKPFRHIFVGANKRSEMIAAGVESSKVAFIEFPSDSKESETSIKEAIGLFSSEKSSRGEHKEKRQYTILSARHDISAKNAEGGVFESIGLSKLRRLIDKDTAFYLLSEDNDANMNALMALESDPCLHDNIIHACVNREGTAYSYKTIMGKTGAHFIHPSSLSVVELMKDGDCHPSQVMQPGKGFNALIIGFGETGQAAAKFIYEFSSAIREDGTPLPVKIYVNDESIERLKGHFRFSCPEMEHDDVIVYENNGLDSAEFWNLLLQRIDELNYIEISMSDEALNLDLACTIYSYAEKKRKRGLDGLRIYVRKKYTPSYEQNLVRRLNEKAGHPVLYCFGEFSKIFTPEMIVSGTSTGINSSATALAENLMRRYERISASSSMKTSLEGTYHSKRSRRRELHQFISRANFIPTLRRYAGGEVEPDDHTLELLSRCEHLRFTRYMLAHGYVYGPQDDDVIKISHQICPWEELTEEEKQYNRDIVLAMLSTELP